MSQSDEIIREVGEDTYKFVALDPLICADLSHTVISILAPALGSFGGQAISEKGDSIGSLLDGISAGNGDNGGSGDYGMALEKSIAGFFQLYTRAQQRELIEMMKGVSWVVLGEKHLPLKSQFDLHFKGRPMAMYMWLGAALHVQLKDFFSSLGPVISRVVQRAAPAQSSSPSTSSETPSSGA